MGRRIFFFLLLALSVKTGFGQTHGVEFSSHEVIPEKRTSLKLSPSEPFCLHATSDLSFDFKFRPGLEIYFGYVMRLITTHNQNIDLIYNQRLRTFNFIIGENFSATFQLDSVQLFSQWNKLLVRFNTKAGEVSIYVNDHFIAKGRTDLSGETCYRAFFGANDYEGFQTIDIPPMQIKDIRIAEDGHTRYYFPLSETQGTQCRDSTGKRMAVLKNPVWIKPRHQNWQKSFSTEVAGVASVAFNKNSETLYIVSVDSVYQFSIKNHALTGLKLARGRDTLPPGNQAVYDQSANKLYNFYIDEKKVSVYDPQGHTWDSNFIPGALTIFWQANKFMSYTDSSLYMIGGYGQLLYKNTVQRYHIPSHKWEIIKPGGDFFMPRYMAALGTNETSDTAWIIGGYGSNTGDQTINPKYNYDLLTYSVKSNSFRLLYHLKEPETPFCFANSLIIDAAGNDFYALTYPKDRFNSTLQLIKGSLRAPVYEPVGDSIPYLFYDVESFADLYYCPVSNKLVAVTMHTTKANISSINVYTIDFPPNHLVPVVSTGQRNGFAWGWLLAAAGATILAGTLNYFIRRRKKMITSAAAPVKAAGQYSLTSNNYHYNSIKEENRKATIYLFGRFEAFDKEGNDITTQFSPLLKELFLIILLYSVKDSKGISPEKLFEMLWSDKSLKDARNNYSVNSVKLKAIIEKIGNCHIGKESGKLKFEITDDSMKIDYLQFVQQVSARPVVDKEYVGQLLNILQRGSFLNEVHYNWLDDFKAEISGLVIDILLGYVSVANPDEEAELIIKITNTIFFFDHLNETALEYKCRSLILLGRYGMAKDAYIKFCREYKENYGTEFEKTFQAMTGHE